MKEKGQILGTKIMIKSRDKKSPKKKNDAFNPHSSRKTGKSYIEI